MNKKLKSDLMLLLTSFIWGSSFIAQSLGSNNLGPFAFNTFRYILAVASLLPVVFYFKKKNNSQNQATAPSDVKGSVNSQAKDPSQKKTLLMGGILIGILLFISGSLQQYAIAFTTSGKAGFITTLYVIFVPVFSIFLGKRINKILWISIVLAAIGLYLLSIKPGTFSISHGDFFVLLCAVGFSFHILLIDYFSPKVDGLVLSCIQFAVVAVISAVATILFETFTVTQVVDSIIPLLCTGVLSSSVGYTFQIVAQNDADPTVASLILSLESVFAALCGALFLGELLNLREITGCILMFVAIVLAQLPSKAK